MIAPYRHGRRWAWYSLWLVPLTGAISARMLADQYPIGYVYAGWRQPQVPGC